MMWNDWDRFEEDVDEISAVMEGQYLGAGRSSKNKKFNNTLFKVWKMI